MLFHPFGGKINHQPLSEEAQYSLEMMTKAIVAKILKEPIRNLKTNGRHNIDYAETVRELFHLDIEKRQ